jgi:hypothetical protein
MFRKNFPRDRKKTRAKKSGQDKSAETRYVEHRVFGKIPLIHHATPGGDGKIYEWWQYDPAYQPTLPRGAVRGDVQKQNFCTAHHVPKYFYLDQEHECIQCGKAFVFHASEQKYWYETLKFNFSSIPIRCAECRRERRTEHALREQIGRARDEASSNNPAAYIALARAIVEYHEKTQHGNLNEAISSARKAKTLWPESSEPDLWEGIAHARAGRKERARTALRKFLSEAGNLPVALKKKAEKYVGSL